MSSDAPAGTSRRSSTQLVGTMANWSFHAPFTRSPCSSAGASFSQWGSTLWYTVAGGFPATVNRNCAPSSSMSYLGFNATMAPTGKVWPPVPPMLPAHGCGPLPG